MVKRGRRADAQHTTELDVIEAEIEGGAAYGDCDGGAEAEAEREVNMAMCTMSEKHTTEAANAELSGGRWGDGNDG